MTALNFTNKVQLVLDTKLPFRYLTSGQTIDHVHIHLIPRYAGDVERPLGGVRGVIPERKEYEGR